MVIQIYLLNIIASNNMQINKILTWNTHKMSAPDTGIDLCLKWNNFSSIITATLHHLLSAGELLDVTLCVDETQIKVIVYLIILILLFIELLKVINYYLSILFFF